MLRTYHGCSNTQQQRGNRSCVRSPTSTPGYEAVKDQFLLGDGILCAPILEPDASTRGVVLPSGRWRDNDGSITEGPAEIVLDVRLESFAFLAEDPRLSECLTSRPMCLGLVARSSYG